MGYYSSSEEHRKALSRFGITEDTFASRICALTGRHTLEQDMGVLIIRLSRLSDSELHKLSAEKTLSLKVMAARHRYLFKYNRVFPDKLLIRINHHLDEPWVCKDILKLRPEDIPINPSGSALKSHIIGPQTRETILTFKAICELTGKFSAFAKPSARSRPEKETIMRTELIASALEILASPNCPPAARRELKSYVQRWKKYLRVPKTS